MLIFFFHLVVKILVQLFIKIKFTTDVKELSQLKMALQLPLNEISQSNLNEKELVVVIISKNMKYYSTVYIAPYNTNFERTRDAL